MRRENQKSNLRLLLRGIRSRISASQRKQAACLAAEHLFFEGPVLSFAPLPGEIDLTDLNQLLALAGRLCLPRIEGTELQMYQVRNLHKDLILSPLGILEPNPKLCARHQTELRALLVPGLGFDRRHARIGYGGGYYDRLLARLSLRPYLTIGVGFQQQLVDGELPTEPHDQPLDQLFLA